MRSPRRPSERLRHVSRRQRSVAERARIEADDVVVQQPLHDLQARGPRSHRGSPRAARRVVRARPPSSGRRRTRDAFLSPSRSWLSGITCSTVEFRSPQFEMLSNRLGEQWLRGFMGRAGTASSPARRPGAREASYFRVTASDSRPRNVMFGRQRSWKWGPRRMSGNRSRSRLSAIGASRRDRAAPAQKWIPCPNA